MQSHLPPPSFGHPELSNIKNMGLHILQKQKVKRGGVAVAGASQGPPSHDITTNWTGNTDAQAAVGVSSAKAYDSHLRGVWQSMKMNSAASGNVQAGIASSQGGVSGRPLAMSGGQISSGATIHNDPASVYQEQAAIASPIIQPAKLKSN